MNTRLRRLIGIFIIPLVLSGCASKVVLVDRANSLVMPDHVARKILAKYFGEDWARNPYLEPQTHALLFCNLEKVQVSFSEIRVVNFISTLKQLQLYDNGHVQIHPFDCGYEFKRLSITVSSESDVQQITDALIALGTPIRGYVKAY